MSSCDEDLTNLEDWLRRLKVEYDIFFNGHRKKPPDDLRVRVEKLVKKLAEFSGMSFAQRFQYNTLIGRFYVYRDLWRRTLSDRESGIDRKEQARAEVSRQVAEAGGAPAKEVRVSITSPESDQGEIRRLYDAVTSLGGSHVPAASRMPFSQFAEYIAGQTLKIRQRSGCASVQFTLAVEGDAIKFKAKPEK